MYYKALIDNDIVDVYDQLQYVKYNEDSKMILRCNKDDEPQGIIQRNGEKIYCVEGWPTLPGEYETVQLVEFDNVDKYLEILDALNENDSYKDDDSIFDDPPQEDVVDPPKNQYVERIEALENITNVMMEVFENG